MGGGLPVRAISYAIFSKSGFNNVLDALMHLVFTTRSDIRCVRVTIFVHDSRVAAYANTFKWRHTPSSSGGGLRQDFRAAAYARFSRALSNKLCKNHRIGLILIT